MYPNDKLTIKTWAEEDRPREKLLLKGKRVLSDAELIAILIGSGNATETAVDLSKRILAGAGNNLNQLGKMSVAELCKYKGIGEAKAISIVAGLELGARRQVSEAVKNDLISSSRDGYEILRPISADLPKEEFWVLFLNRANKVIMKDQISSGGVNGTVVDLKVIFKKALELLSSGIILAHNHPSGQLRPSREDDVMTKRLVEAGRLLEIPVLDHLIITDNGYFSYADEGKL
ncbi:DNA repair protein RadC [soil metagenome]